MGLHMLLLLHALIPCLGAYSFILCLAAYKYSLSFPVLLHIYILHLFLYFLARSSLHPLTLMFYSLYMMCRSIYHPLPCKQIDLYDCHISPQSNTTVVVTQQPTTVLPTPVFRDHPVTVVDSNGQQVDRVPKYLIQMKVLVYT